MLSSIRLIFVLVLLLVASSIFPSKSSAFFINTHPGGWGSMSARNLTSTSVEFYNFSPALTSADTFTPGQASYGVYANNTGFITDNGCYVSPISFTPNVSNNTVDATFPDYTGCQYGDSYFTAGIGSDYLYNTCDDVTTECHEWSLAVGPPPGYYQAGVLASSIKSSYTLSGTVFQDNNQDGVQNPGESGYSGATVRLNTGQSTTTDSNGNYTFSNLESGTYTETITVPSGYTATTINPATVALAADTTQNFGIAQAQATPVAAINVGGNTEGNYAADTDYTGGTTYSTTDSVDTSNVDNPAPQAVYKSVRYGNFSYTIPNLTANGTYTVRLHFNELYWNAAGQRTFNVAINGDQVLSNFDIYQTAGGKNKAIVEQFPAIANSSGNVTIQFTTVTDSAMVNGIEVYSGTLPTPTPSPTPTPVNSLAISAGGQGSGSYIADTDYTGGTTYNTSASIDTSGVTNPAPQSVYQNVRYGNTFSYTIPTYSPNTNYSVRLDFAEPYWNTGGQRLFNVSINGTQDLSNFDVYQAAGGENKAISETFNTTTDSNGLIHIQFDSVTDNAMVSGIFISQ